jgi:RHS repeat-associated protein
VQVIGLKVYLGSKLINETEPGVSYQGAVRDRLGSNRSGSAYFPYGEEQNTTGQEKDKFGTYYRDSSGLDYADQRYYASTLGQFLSPDPYKVSAGPSDPGSWNRFAYVEGDPANFNDATGLNKAFCIDGLCDGGGGGPGSYEGFFDAAGYGGGGGGGFLTFTTTTTTTSTNAGTWDDPSWYTDTRTTNVTGFGVDGWESDGTPIFRTEVIARRPEVPSGARSKADSGRSLFSLSDIGRFLRNTSLVPTGSIIAPIPGTGPGGFPLLGIQVDVTYIPRTNQLCGSIGIAFSPNGAAGFGLTVLFDPQNRAPGVIPGFAAGTNLQSNPIAGLTAIGSRGQPVLLGPTIGTKGIVMNAGWGACTAGGDQTGNPGRWYAEKRMTLSPTLILLFGLGVSICLLAAGTLCLVSPKKAIRLQSRFSLLVAEESAGNRATVLQWRIMGLLIVVASSFLIVAIVNDFLKR